jgi:hypothetical protein
MRRLLVLFYLLMDRLPPELVIMICRNLPSRHDYARLCCASRALRDACTLTPLNRRALFCQFLTEEVWDFDRLVVWTDVYALTRPLSTIILYNAVLLRKSFQYHLRRVVALGWHLVHVFEKNNEREYAIRIVEAIWQDADQSKGKSNDPIDLERWVDVICEKEDYRKTVRRSCAT